MHEVCRQSLAQLFGDCMDKLRITNKSILPSCIDIFGSVANYIGGT